MNMYILYLYFYLAMEHFWKKKTLIAMWGLESASLVSVDGLAKP